MERSVVDDLFSQLIEINQRAFRAGLYNVAYHALMSALHCAEEMPGDQPLMTVSRLALDQIKWIDQNHPEYEHSTQSAKRRKMSESIFARASVQAETILKMRGMRAGRQSR